MAGGEMGSPEVVDSSSKRMNFSQTCSLLSQFLKGDSGKFGEQLSLGLSQNLERKGTMNLLPMIEKSGQNQATPSPNSPLNMFHHLAGAGASVGGQETMKKSDISCGMKSGVETAPLTIFYAGQVIVFKDFPADKANEIMMLAGKSGAAAAQNLNFSAGSAPPISPQSPTESAASFPNVVSHPPRIPPLPQFVSDLPIARKNSLARFLEKRKDRSIASEPYPARKPADPKKNEAWLRLGAIN